MTRKLLVVLVVLLVLLVAIPLGMGAAMGMCPNLHSSICPSVVGSCAAIMGLMVLVLIAVLGTVATRAPLAQVLLLARIPERPPRTVSP